MSRRGKYPRGFTMLELQVAILLLALGIATLSSLMTSQSRLYRKLRGDFKPDSTIYLTPPTNPWERNLGTPAHVTAAPITLTPPAALSNPSNNVTILDMTKNLADESITVSTTVTETP